MADKKIKKFQFDRDWLKPHLSHWKKNLLGLGSEKINVLEIGAFEGRSTTWILENLFRNPKSKLITIDTFETVIEGINNEKTFHKNIKKTGKENQTEVIKSKSWDALIRLNQEKRIMFDFIYIDGSHLACDVLADAILSWNLLKENGIMLFDDYEWGRYNEEYNNPKIAIDAFLNCYQWQIKVVEKYYQLIIKKVIKGNVKTKNENYIRPIDR